MVVLLQPSLPSSETQFQTAVTWLVGLELLFCFYELGFVAGYVSAWAQGDDGKPVPPQEDKRHGSSAIPSSTRTIEDASITYLLQITEALVCLSAIYVVKSNTHQTILSPNWLLVYLLYNFVDVVYMQLGEWVARFDPAYTSSPYWWRGKSGKNVSIGPEDLSQINWAMAYSGKI